MRHLRNLAWFLLGLTLSGLFLAPYAFAQVPQVSGPFSPFPPPYNPYLPSPISTAGATTAGTAAGATSSVSGAVNVATKAAGVVSVPTTVAAQVSRARVVASALRCTTPITGLICVATAAQVANELLNRPVGLGRYRACPDGTFGFICKESGGYSSPISGYSCVSGTARCSVSGGAAPGQGGTNGSVHVRPSEVFVTAQGLCDAYVARNQDLAAMYLPVTITATKTECRDAQGGVRLVTKSGAVCTDGSLPNTSEPLEQQCGGPVVVEPASDSEVTQSLQDKLNEEYDANRRLYEALKRDYLDKPESFPPDAIPVDSSTPVTVQQTPVTTPKKTESVTEVPKPDGSKDTITRESQTTVTPTTAGSTAGDSKTTYQTTTVITTTTTNNVTNVTNVTTETQTDDAKPDDMTFADSSMPSVPALYIQKYPDGIGGVWRDHKPNLQGTQFWQGVSQMFPSFGSGTCPSWSMSFSIMPLANYGTMPFNVPCWIFQAVGLIILTTAAFTARKIIF